MEQQYTDPDWLEKLNPIFDRFNEKLPEQDRVRHEWVKTELQQRVSMRGIVWTEILPLKIFRSISCRRIKSAGIRIRSGKRCGVLLHNGKSRNGSLAHNYFAPVRGKSPYLRWR